MRQAGKAHTHFERLLTKIQDRTARLAVVGMGYVGLPLAVEFARSGFHTTGVDTDEGKVKAINSGRSYIKDISDSEVAVQVKDGRLQATSDFSILKSQDTVSICVPTPLSKTKDPDLSYIIAATDTVAKHVHAGMLIVLESTTYPGTTEEIVVPRLLRNNLQAGRNVFVAFSPERIDPGRKDFTIHNTPRVVGGVTSKCLAVAMALYQCIVAKLVPVSSASAAEMVKLLENTFRSVNIALANEFLMICDKLGLDVWEVIEAAATKPYGFMKFTPGPGVGGHCIPLDPHYLLWKMRTLNYNTRFIQLAGEINASMPEYWVNKVGEALNRRGKSIKNSRVLVLGVTYKPDVSDVRESPALDILKLLEARGARAQFNDPFIRSLRPEGRTTPFVELTAAALKAADCIMIVTQHSNYDWSRIQRLARCIVDTRHVLKREEKIIMAET